MFVRHWQLKPRVGAAFDAYSKLTSNDLEPATDFNTFTSVFAYEPVDVLPSIPLSTTLVLKDFDLSVEAIHQIIRSSKHPLQSSPGLDGISNELLKEGSSSLFRPTAITSFFLAILAKGSLPQEWRTANVVPIFNAGYRSQCSNYRPVSLTYTLCKLFERLLLKNRILDYLLTNNLLMNTQHRFLPRRLCCSALLSYLEMVTYIFLPF